jgi:hypothetical protein
MENHASLPADDTNYVTSSIRRDEMAADFFYA